MNNIKNVVDIEKTCFLREGAPQLNPNHQARKFMLTLEFLKSIDPQISLEPGKFSQSNKDRLPNKHRTWNFFICINTYIPDFTVICFTNFRRKYQAKINKHKLPNNKAHKTISIVSRLLGTQ